MGLILLNIVDPAWLTLSSVAIAHLGAVVDDSNYVIVTLLLFTQYFNATYNVSSLPSHENLTETTLLAINWSWLIVLMIICL